MPAAELKEEVVEQTLAPGTPYTLRAKVVPADATDKALCDNYQK